MPPPKLYAMYLQATRLNPNTEKTMRKQWIVLPPFPPEVATPLGLTGKDLFLMFHREQQNPENRVKWRYLFDANETMTRTLPIEIKNMLNQNNHLTADGQWNISPVITAQVTPKELSDLQANPQTPYVLLRRFEKVASKKYGLSI